MQSLLLAVAEQQRAKACSAVLAQLTELDLLSWLAKPASGTTSDLAWHSLAGLRGTPKKGIGDASGNPRPADGIISWLAV